MVLFLLVSIVHYYPIYAHFSIVVTDFSAGRDANDEGGLPGG